MAGYNRVTGRHDTGVDDILLTAYCSFEASAGGRKPSGKMWLFSLLPYADDMDVYSVKNLQKNSRRIKNVVCGLFALSVAACGHGPVCGENGSRFLNWQNAGHGAMIVASAASGALGNGAGRVASEAIRGASMLTGEKDHGGPSAQPRPCPADEPDDRTGVEPSAITFH